MTPTLFLAPSGAVAPMDQLEYNDRQVEAMKEWLSNMADAEGPDDFGHEEFEVADGVTVDFDWSQDYNEPMLIVSILIGRGGFQLFTRGTGKTLSETGSYGFGPNHGDTISADVAGWVAKSFNDDFDEMVFEYDDQLSPNLWLFQASVPNPHFNWE